MSDLTGALLASAQLLPFHSNKDKGHWTEFSVYVNLSECDIAR